MLKLEIGREVVIEEGRKVRFGVEVEYVLELEHSLASLSKWEEIWEKPFISEDKYTPDEMISYIRCMVLDPDPPPDFVLKLSEANINAVNEYINAKMTATWFTETNQPVKKSSEKITAELIYYWLSNVRSMPPGFERWHLNKLFTFIKIYDVKNQPAKKVSTAEAAAQRRAINAQNRAKYNSRG